MAEQTETRHVDLTLKTQFLILGGFILLIWGIEFADWLIFGGQLDSYGIRPRSVEGLPGILLAPFLHGGFRHLTANTLPFLVLGWLILSTRGLVNFLKVSIIIILIGGLGAWLTGPTHSVHLGASGLVFGYFGFLLLMAYFERSLAAIALALLVVFLYGGLIWGVLPQGGGISWQSHLFGFVGGGFAAHRLAERSQP